MRDAISTADVTMQDAINLVDETLNIAEKPQQMVPPFYTTIEGLSRPGASEMRLTEAIIQRLGEGGMNTGNLPDGAESFVKKFVRIIVEELIKEMQLKFKGMVEIPPGTLMGMAGQVPVISTVPVQGHSIMI